MSGSRSRRVAYDVLHRVAADDAYANLALDAALREAGLGRADAGLATDVVYTVLRMRLTLDAVLGLAVDRPLAKVDPRVLDVLRMAAAEHMYLRTPAHAVTNNAVNLARSVAGQPASRFVNAVVRRLVARTPDDLLGSAVAPLSGDARLAVEHSHPEWIVRAFRDALGARAPELPELLVADNTPAQVTLVARPARMSRSELPGTPTRWSPWGVRLDRGNPGSLPAVRNGTAGVQDLGSQLVVLAASRAEVAGDGRRWLDMCAGPGGKAALLADLAGPEGWLVAAELHEHRAALVRRALAGTPARTEVLVGDAAEVAGSFDRVLLDAPCTGLGVLRRRPESRWRRTPADVADLSGVQERLLAAAIERCRTGGVVVYVTCSPHLAETEFVVEQVIRGREDVSLEPAAGLLPEVPDCADGPFLRLWPHLHDTDGMFLAVLRKR